MARKLAEFIAEDSQRVPDEMGGIGENAELVEPYFEQRELAELGLTFLPGVGNVLSGRDAIEAAKRARDAFAKGDYAEAAEQSFYAILGGFGAVPGLGLAIRTGRVGVKLLARAIKGAQKGERAAKVTGKEIADEFKKIADPSVDESSMALATAVGQAAARAAATAAGDGSDGGAAPDADDGANDRPPAPKPKSPGAIIDQANRDVREAARGRGFEVVEITSAEAVNADYPGYDPLPALPGTEARIVRLTEEMKAGDFVRVHREERQRGRWFLAKEDSDGPDGKVLEPGDIEAQVALPETPTHVSDVVLPKGTQVRISVVNESQTPDGSALIQYEIFNEKTLPSSWFRNMKPLRNEHGK